MAVDPLIDGCRTFDFPPSTIVGLHQDRRPGRIDARIFYAPEDFSSNVEWRNEPFATDDWREVRFKAVWKPLVHTLIHPIERVEEWAVFNIDRYPEGLDQVLEYHGDEAVRTAGWMAARVVEKGSALRYRIPWRRAKGKNHETGPFIVSRPRNAGRMGRRGGHVAEHENLRSRP